MMKILYTYIFVISLVGCSEKPNSDKVLNKKIVETKFVSSDPLEQFHNVLKLSSGGDTIEINSIQLDVLPDELYEELQAIIIRMDCIMFPCVIELSPKISSLRNLEELHIIKSSLRELPVEIGELSHLRVLNILGGGKLKSVPVSIGRLENLEELNFFRNSLSTLPNSISKLSKLKILNLIENKFSSEERERIRKMLPNCKVKFEY